MTKLSKAFALDADKIRIKEFEFNGQKFKIRVPLAKEAEEMFKNAENPPQEMIDEKFKALSEEIYKNRQSIEESEADIRFVEDDVFVGSNSLKELAKSQASGEMRILESFKLLVPADGTRLDITYADIEEEFPLPIQLALVKKITETVSPNYEESRKNS